MREKRAFRVRLLADASFVFTSLVREWSSPTRGVSSRVFGIFTGPDSSIPPRRSSAVAVTFSAVAVTFRGDLSRAMMAL